MKVRALALALLASCSNGTAPPVPAVPGGPSVTVDGKEIFVQVWATERERRSILYVVPRLEEGRGLLLAWPRERYLKVESEASPAPYDVAFLDRAGRIVETGELAEGNPEGIMSRVEAAYALLLPKKSAALKVGAAAALSAAAARIAPQELPAMRIGDVTARVELALTEADRAHGLMFRPRMSADDGMLFAYDHEGMRHFWMKNTLIPLDIAFFRADGTLLNVNDTPMYPDPRNPPADYATSDSAEAARYVLEMNRGWFRGKGLVGADGKVKPGIKAEIPRPASTGRFD